MSGVIISKSKGGLGNQMFQYAVGRNLAIRNNSKLIQDLTELEKDAKRNYELGIFNIDWQKITPARVKKPRKALILLLSKVLKKTNSYIVQMDNYYNPRVLQSRGNVVLDGYWQSEKYFEEIEDTIRREFTIKTEADKKNKSMLEKIKSTNSVCLHVRRGDYVHESKASKLHGTCTLEYYKKSIELMNGKLSQPTYFIFSDDIIWTKKNLKIEKPAIFVDINSSGKSYEDLRLMSNCNHFIIANSTFSWWAAWLSGNSDKIICAPKRWFNTQEEGDIVPKEWIRVDGVG